MASIGPVTLSIFDGPDDVRVRVDYEISATHHDAEHEQAYREVIELVGVDTGEPGEDQVDDVIAAPSEWDGIVVFTTSQVKFVRSPELPSFAAATLDEDAHPFVPRSDEIRARVTLTPLPATASSRESNLVRRQVIAPPTP
jgi:hypothetical protein